MELDPILTTTGLFDDILEPWPCTTPLGSLDAPMEEEEEGVTLNDVFPKEIHSYARDPDVFLSPLEQCDDPVIPRINTQEPEPIPESASDEEQAPSPAPRSTRRRRQKRQRRVSIETDAAASIFSNGKPKLYTQRPFNNPDQERARQNALNAKMNREKKKMEALKMKKELERLRQENQSLKKSSLKLKSRASQAEIELQRLRDVLAQSNLADVLKWTSDQREE